MSLGAIIAIVIVVAIAAVVIILLLRRPGAAAQPSAGNAEPEANATPRGAAPTSAPPTSAPPTSAPRAAPAPIAALAPAGEVPAILDKVSCTVNGAVHGAMPPFGKLSCSDGVVLFEATSRVVTKAGGLGEDGSSTLQSLGAIEMGKFRFEINVNGVQRVDFSKNKAAVHADAGLFEFEAYATSGPQLQPWLSKQGLAD